MKRLTRGGPLETSRDENDDNYFVDRRWNESFPAFEHGPVPSLPYYSTDYFEREKSVFAQTWLNVGRVEAMPNPGDYVVHDLEALGQSVIVSRTAGGELSATHNTCSHRGNRLLIEPRGTADQIVCSYHGWRYALDGECEFIPDEGSFVGLERSCAALAKISVDEWNGFIFINLNPSPAQSLRDHLGSLGDALEDYPFEQFSKSGVHYSCEVPANWKLVRDAFIENYHVQFVHKLSVPNLTYGRSNPYSHMFDMEFHGRHSRTSPYINPDYQRSPMEQFFKDRRGEATAGADPKSWIGQRMARIPGWYQDINLIYPNFVATVSGGQVFGTYFTYNFWPIAPDRTRMDHSVYFRAPDSAGSRAAQEYGKVLQRDAWLEDFSVLDHQHQAVASGAKQHFYLQNQELAIRHANIVMDAEIAACEVQ